jgi:hypothetical protein
MVVCRGFNHFSEVSILVVRNKHTIPLYPAATFPPATSDRQYLDYSQVLIVVRKYQYIDVT